MMRKPNYLVEGEPQSKYFAIGYITEDTNGVERYVWRHKVKCSIPSEEHKTKDDGTDANGQELTFTGINTIHKFSTTNKTAKSIVYKANKNLFTEQEFFSIVQDVDKVQEKATQNEKLS